MQKMMLVGNLTKDPELRDANGKKVCNFTLAVNSRKKDSATGAIVNVATFYRITTWNTEAENCAKYLRKGRCVALTGELSVSVAKTSDGKIMYHNGTGDPIINLEVTAEGRVQFLSNPSAAEGSGYTPTPTTEPGATSFEPPAPAAPSGFTAVETDELPF